MLWLHTLTFYILASTMIGSALAVVSLRNTVHAVLLLVLTFFSASGLLILVGAEFLAFILIVVYVGAITILFLFIIMLMDINIKQELKRNLPVAIIIASLFLLELVFVFFNWKFGDVQKNITSIASDDVANNLNNIGAVLYTKYFLVFQLSGIVLLVGMIGAICLSINKNKDAKLKKQDPQKQNARNPENSIRLIK